MAGDLSDAAREFRDLARGLIWAGEEGLRRELGDAIDAAAAPLVAEIGNVGHLRDYMPDRYADVFAADLRITVSKRTVGPQTGVSLLGRAPTHGRGGRKILQRDLGFLVHPIFPQGPRRTWRWVSQEDGRKGIRPGFFTDPAEASAPRVREAIVAAVERVAEKATRRA